MFIGATDLRNSSGGKALPDRDNASAHRQPTDTAPNGRHDTGRCRGSSRTGESSDVSRPWDSPFLLPEGEPRPSYQGLPRSSSRGALPDRSAAETLARDLAHPPCVPPSNWRQQVHKASCKQHGARESQFWGDKFYGHRGCTCRLEEDEARKQLELVHRATPTGPLTQTISSSLPFPSPSQEIATDSPGLRRTGRCGMLHRILAL